jgi:hypothetical protein
MMGASPATPKASNFAKAAMNSSVDKEERPAPDHATATSLL